MAAEHSADSYCSKLDKGRNETQMTSRDNKYSVQVISGIFEMVSSILRYMSEDVFKL
jgi:hypothetical protein